MRIDAPVDAIMDKPDLSSPTILNGLNGLGDSVDPFGGVTLDSVDTSGGSLMSALGLDSYGIQASTDTFDTDIWGTLFPTSAGSTSSSSSSSSSANPLAAILAPLSSAASQILKTQYGTVPPLSPGEYYNSQTGVAYQQPAGVAITGTTLGTTGGSIFIIGGVLLVAFLLFGRK